MALFGGVPASHTRDSLDRLVVIGLVIVFLLGAILGVLLLRL